MTIVGLAALAAALFVAVARSVDPAGPHGFDEAILLALRNPADPSDPIGPWWVEAMFRDITALGGTTVLTLVTMIVSGFLAAEGRYRTALLVLVAVAGGTLVSTGLKEFFERPRPELVGHLVDVRTFSFPSGHAMLSAVTYLTLGALLMRVSARRRARVFVMTVATLLTVLIGASRVYLGVHYPTDVLAGWAAGFAWAMLCWLLASWMQRRGQLREPDLPSS